MLVVAGFLFGWDKALYSILFQFASTQVIKLLDPSGRRATLFIVTRRETAQAVWQQIRDTHHSATLFQGTGLYDGEERVMLYSVVGGNQVRALIHRVRQTDPHAFVNVMRTADCNFFDMLRAPAIKRGPSALFTAPPWF